ncbi:MAG: hypothetical protein QW279_13445 [Candidatus Jordarchaeaceae archaeon]
MDSLNICEIFNTMFPLMMNTIIRWLGFGDALPISTDCNRMWWFGDALPNMALSLNYTDIFGLYFSFRESKNEKLFLEELNYE